MTSKYPRVHQRTFVRVWLQGTLSSPQTPCCTHDASSARFGCFKFYHCLFSSLACLVTSLLRTGNQCVEYIQWLSCCFRLMVDEMRKQNSSFMLHYQSSHQALQRLLQERQQMKIWLTQTHRYWRKYVLCYFKTSCFWLLPKYIAAL